MLGGGIDLSVGSIFALACFSPRSSPSSSSSSRSGWPSPPRSRPALAVRRDQRLSRRLYAAARLPDHAGHLDHRPRALRHPGGELRHRHPALRRIVRHAGTSSATARSTASRSRSSTAIVIAILAHIALTRSRPGWHILAVGGSRRSAYNSGINVERTVFMTYVISGLCCGLAGFLFACRLSGAGPGTGARSGDPGADRRRGRRQHAGRRARLDRQGRDGRHHRAGHDQRPDPPRLSAPAPTRWCWA